MKRGKIRKTEGWRRRGPQLPPEAEKTVSSSVLITISHKIMNILAPDLEMV